MLRLFICLLFLVLTGPLLAGAVPLKQSPLDRVATALKMSYPQIPLKQLNPTPIEGIFEVITQKDEILYFASRTGHLFVGEIWNNAGQNLTRESHSRLMTKKLALFPLDKALKIGDGPNTVIEVADPDCPFCREGSAFFSTRDDVTRYVFLYPLERIHPQADAKSRYILSAEDPETAYEEVFSGEYDQKPLPEFKDNGLLDTHKQIVRKVGINSTPRYWINGEYISGTNLKKFEEQLNR